MPELTRLKAIQAFFEEGENGRPVTTAELTALDDTERDELGAACAQFLGVTLKAKQVKA